MRMIQPPRSKVRLNTSSEGKLQEYQKLFSQYNVLIETTNVDLDEIDADILSVVAHKASQVPEGVVVEDTSLDIEDARIGVHIRWFLDHLNELQGNKACWISLLAKRVQSKIYIYSGKVEGAIVTKRGSEGFGFDPYFLPRGEKKTLAESKPDSLNARALAVSAFMEGKESYVVDPIYEWKGNWQHN